MAILSKIGAWLLKQALSFLVSWVSKWLAKKGAIIKSNKKVDSGVDQMKAAQTAQERKDALKKLARNHST